MKGIKTILDSQRFGHFGLRTYWHQDNSTPRGFFPQLLLIDVHYDNKRENNYLQYNYLHQTRLCFKIYTCMYKSKHNCKVMH